MSAGMSMILQSEIRITELLQEPLSKIFLTIGFARPAESARMISALRTKVNKISLCLWRPSVCRHFFVLWERRGGTVLCPDDALKEEGSAVLCPDDALGEEGSAVLCPDDALGEKGGAVPWPNDVVKRCGGTGWGI